MTSRKARPRGDEILIEREECDTNYTVMPNEAVNDSSLSFTAKGLLWYICARPGTWKVVPAQLRAVCRKRLSLPAVRKLLGELIEAGYGQRELVRDDMQRIVGTRYRFSNRPKFRADASRPARDDASARPEQAAGNAVSRFSVARENRETENLPPVVSNDRYKLPPQSPPSGADGAQSQSPTQAANDTEGIRPASGPLRSPTTGEPPGKAEGLPREENAEPLEPVTVLQVIRAYELINRRNIRKAEERLRDLTPTELAALWQSLDQLTAYHARTGKRPPELWEYAGTRGFRQFPPKKASADPDAVLARERPPDPDAVLAGPLGLRAAQGRWVQELVEFIAAQRRVPDEIECARMERDGGARHQQLLIDERAIAEGRMVSPGVAVFLGKRRMLIAKALRMHGREPPDVDPPQARPAMRAETEEFVTEHYGSGR